MKYALLLLLSSITFTTQSGQINCTRSVAGETIAITGIPDAQLNTAINGLKIIVMSDGVYQWACIPVLSLSDPTDAEG